jgi:hypothetical protein
MPKLPPESLELFKRDIYIEYLQKIYTICIVLIF